MQRRQWREREKLEKNLAWQLTNVRNQKEVIDEARNQGRKVYFSSLMDLCHLKNSDQYQKYRGRNDIVKDDSGSYAVLNEQGSSASQMTAAKVMDIIYPDCQGAQDKPCTQVEEAPKLLKTPKSECPDIWIRLPRHKWPKSWSSLEDPVVPLDRNLYGHPSAGLLWRRQFGKILLKHGWKKVSNCECFFVHRATGLFLSVYVDVIELAGKTENTEPTLKFPWKTLT